MRERSSASEPPPAPKMTLPLVRKVATSSNPRPSKICFSFALGAFRVAPRLTARRNAAWVGPGIRLVDQALGHAADREPPERERERAEAEEAQGVHGLEAEGGAPHELDQLVERVEVGGHLQSVGQLIDREEGARDQ